MKWHELPIENVLKNLDASPDGLSSSEAKRRQAEIGPNKISGTKPKPLILRFFGQFNDFMIIILLSAAAISLTVSFVNGERDFLDPAIILLIVVLNAILGLVQEYKAERSLAALQKMTSPMAVALRDGQPTHISTEELVPGDIIMLEAGDFCPADARLIESSNIRVEESMLTGESLPVEKNASHRFTDNTAIGDRKNMLFSGTSVVYGHGRAIIVATAMDTEMGRIANMILSQDSPKTPLQRRLEKTGRILGMGALAICVAIFALGVLRNISPFDMFMTSVSLAVAAIPEGLPAIVTIMLAIGVQRMAKANGIIRKLPAVETLGSATVICSDKTGTLTQNKMKVVEFTSPKVLAYAALCSNASLTIGDPTEVALVQEVPELDELKQKYTRLDELPFDSERKRMSVLVKSEDKYMLIAKGAFDILVDRSSYYDDNGVIKPITTDIKNKFAEENAAMAGQALRVLAVAYRPLPDKPSNLDGLEKHLVLMGLVGMIDPPRPEVTEAVKTCKTAGIRPVMITGDHILTAKAIARQVGIFQDGTAAITGKQLSEMSEEELAEDIHRYSVFARVSPDHKVRIVQALQKNGEVVAMTGDGVNDAPALKAADIGCAMGQSGTDVAKGAADMILTDDNFATIVKAVKEGRGIYSNIRKAVHFLLSSNIGEIVTIFVAIFMGWRSPLLAIHLLWVNLVTDSLPAIALGVDPVDKGIMNRPPYDSQKSMFSGGIWARIGLEGLMIGLLALIAFGIGVVFYDEATARTLCFMVLSIAQLFHAFNMRTNQSLLSINPFSNAYLVGALFVGILLQAGVATIPVVAHVFRVVPLSMEQWSLVLALSVMPIVIIELQKWWTNAVKLPKIVLR